MKHYPSGPVFDSKKMTPQEMLERIVEDILEAYKRTDLAWKAVEALVPPMKNAPGISNA